MSELNIPIAVIGLACRFPRGVRDAESLWEALLLGHTAWSDVPADRYDWRSFYHPVRGSRSAHSARGGYFLDTNIAEFDANFFGFSPHESAAMDPQQRVLLEVTYEAMENAGISIDSIKGSNTGVYIATFNHDYENMMYHDSLSLPKYGMTGIGTAIASNRISYFFDLKGPSLSLDTGCSGGLVSLHQACQSLRCGETNTAFVGGTNLILSPDTMISMDNLHILNENGTCYPFDSRGSGYGRGEGAALVILKRLDDALKAGDSIRAVIRNTVVGQDGRTRGITLPNGDAQESLIRSAYKAISLKPCYTGYVEAHGTGTVAGDVAEIQALGRVFCENRENDKALYVGSIKGNIGHLESVSGLAGLIKIILLLEKGVIPATPSFNTPKDRIDLSKLKIKIPQSPQYWPSGFPRRASLNSFGYGGTNAHAIIEAAPLDYLGTNVTVAVRCNSILQCKGSTRNGTSNNHINTDSNGEVSRKSDNSKKRGQTYQIFPLVAKTEETLRLVVRNLKDWASKNQTANEDLADLSHTLIRRVSRMPFHCTIVASGPEQLISRLEQKELNLTRTSNKTTIIFIFTGQGAQWQGMAKELLCSSTVFRDSLRTSEMILKSLGSSWSLAEELGRDKSTTRIDESKIAQPLTTAIQIALVQLLRSLNTIPKRVLGHSSGEIAAAYTAGILSHESAMKLSYYRGLLGIYCKRVLGINGAMLAVGLGGHEIMAYLKLIECGRVSIACFNSPFNTTVSGDEHAIEELSRILQRFGISSQKLRIDTAYHSHHMEAAAEDYLRSVGDIQCLDPSTSTTFHSSVTGKKKQRGFGAAYWIRNLVSKVLFTQALQGLWEQLESETYPAESTSYVMMELGPSNALNFSINQALTHQQLDMTQYTYMSPLKRGCDAQLTFLQVISKLFDKGHPVDIAGANRLDSASNISSRRVLGDLPTYPWDHSVSYWHESQISREHRLRTHSYHDLLGIRITGTPDIQPRWRHILSIENSPWLRDHAVDGRLVFPGSGYLAMAIEAKRQLLQDSEPDKRIRYYIIKDVIFSKFLEIPEAGKDIEVQISLINYTSSQNNVEGWQEFRVVSTPKSGVFIENCKGLIKIEHIETSDSSVDIYPFDDAKREQDYMTSAAEKRFIKLENDLYHKLEPKTFYERLQLAGNYWGPSFAAITDFIYGDFDAIGKITIPNVQASMPGEFTQPHIIHPTTLDTLIHSSLVLSSQSYGSGVMFPISVEEIIISADVLKKPGQQLSFMTSLTSTTSNSISSDVFAFRKTQSGKMASSVEIKGSKLRKTVESESSRTWSGPSWCYNLEWGLDLDFSQPELESKTEHTESSFTSPDTKINALNDQVYRYVHRCLDSIDENTVEGKYTQYYKWMTKFTKSKVSSSDPKISGSNTESIQTLGVEGEVIMHIGTNLCSILIGKIDPLQLLLKNDLLQRIYAESTAALQCYQYLVTYVKALTFKNPNMKVLEVGGGTAGATLPLFKGTSQYGKLPLRLYDFTDISAGFFDNARHVLRRWERQLSFKTFDCSKDPVAQGFEVGTYDLIIAYNAIHASRSIDESITNVRKLLKTGGRLMLIEITRLEPFVNAIFGLLPGWYMDRSDGRKDAPILSVEEWNSRLIHGGFNGCEFVRHDQDGPSKTTSLIVSRAISVAKEILKSFPTYIVHDNSQSVRSLLGQKIQKLSFQTARIHLSTQCIDNEALYVIIDDHLYGSILSSSSKLIDRVSKVVSGAKNVLWIITPRYSSAISNHAHGLAIGFARGVRASNEAINFVTFDIQGDSIDFDDLDKTIHNLSNACFLSSNFSMDMDYIYRDGKVQIPRLKPNRNCQSTTLSKMTTGLAPSHQCNQIIQPLQKRYVISNPSQYIATNLPGAPSRHSDIEVKVDAWSVSTEDLLASFGQGPSKSIIGGFFGTILSVGHQDSWKTGDQIYGWSKAIYANSVRVSADSVCHYPKSISIEEAVCIPITFMTAFYALVDIGRIRKGQGVIVHDAVSPIGQAAIQVSRYIGADVIAVITVEEHRQYLIDKYKLSEDRVILPHDSRHFRIAVSRRLTNNGGAQLILNPSSGGGQLIVDSITCLARFGTFIQIGSIDTSSKLSISTEIFEKNVSVISPHLAATSELQPEKMTELMRHVNLMFETGNMLPITPARTMKIGEIENAVKLIQQENLTGQIVLETSRTARVDLVSTPSLLKYTEDATYLVVGNSTILSIDVYKFLLLYGAMNILILFTGTWEEKTKIEKRLAQEETKIRIVSSANEISINLHDIPPIRGIIYTEFVSIFHPTTSVDIAGYIERDVEHINSIMSCIKPEILDFLVIISSSLLFPRARTRSIDCAIFASRQALLASGLKEKTRLIHIDIANLVPMAESYQSEQEEISLGRSNYSRQETFAILESELRSTEQYQGYSHVVAGLRESIFRGKIKLPLDSSLLRNLPEIWKQDESTITTVPHQTTLESINDSIVYAKTEEQARRIVELAVRKKIASMMAVQYELIDTKTSIEDFGLDSLIIFTFRNWIFQNFRADLNVGIISSASSIDDLVSGILSLTTINNFANQNESKSEHHDSHFKPATSFSIPCSDYRTDLLPKQPLPDLEDTLRYYLDAARTFCSEEELTTTKRLVEDFKSIGGQGYSLQSRLLERQNDSKLDNWLSDIYLTRRFLQQRAPLLATQSYFGTHPNGPISHTQAERAVIVTLAALKFKISYESGSLSKQGLYGQAIDTHAYRYLFNVCREPHVSEDIIREYPRENHIVVFNNGHGYKINLTMNNEDISFDDLETLFKKILQEPIEPKSWAGILTADSRDDWAEARDSLIQLDKRNKLSVETIQAAAFIVCFDNATPETPLQRFSQFLFGDGSNRWYDKSLQFVVCKNGISASLCEHSVLDGITIGFLHEFINQAIFEYESSSHTNRVTTPNSSLLEPLNLSLDPFLEDRIKKVRQNFTETTSKYSFAHLQLNSLSQEFLSEKGLPTQSGIQLAIQLAYLRFFNYSPPALETVSLAQFRQGRVEVHHIITPLMAQFILTNKNAINPHSRRLLYDAAREHAKSLTRASKGRGFSRHLLALEWMLREGEESPAFFQDPVYKRMKPAKAVTSFFATGWQEGGFVYPFPGSILVYFEVKDDSVLFSIFGNEADAEGFRNHLELSGADMRRLLDGPEPDDS